jgi:hypothetical protein
MSDTPETKTIFARVQSFIDSDIFAKIIKSHTFNVGFNIVLTLNIFALLGSVNLPIVIGTVLGSIAIRFVTLKLMPDKNDTDKPQ